MMTYSKTGIALTERFEGCRRLAYQDSVGRWTIGYGHTFNVCEGDTCTDAEAEAWLVGDYAWAEKAVNRLVTTELTQGEFDALTDFTFNLGVGSLEHSTLLRLVDSRQFAAAALEFPKWAHAGGVEVAGLLRRRVAEQALFTA